MVKQSMAEEDNVADEDDGIMSEDAAKKRKVPKHLMSPADSSDITTIEHYWNWERMPQHRAEALQSIILTATPMGGDLGVRRRT